MTAAHSRLGASSMYRWSKCPGSVRETDKAPKRESVYAAEGSNAHALAADCLKSGRNPGYYVGKTVTLDKRTFAVDQEMADAVQVYVAAVDEAIAEGNDEGTKHHIEQKFDLSSVYPGCFGTADAVIWKPDAKLLIVMDYKHGSGVPVEARNNPQLQYYGLGALLQNGYPARTVRLVIVQPRCDHADGPVRQWEIDAIDLLDFRADLISYAKATEDPKASLVPGDHCQFCSAAALCPALHAKAQSVAKLEFSPALSYDPEKLKLALDSREPLNAWLKALDEFAYAEAMEGRKPLGYKLVEKRANRKWSDEGAVVDRLQDTFGDVIWQPRKVRSPAQMEKELTKPSFASVADLIIKESSGLALVPDSDKRPAARPSAKDEFIALEAA